MTNIQLSDVNAISLKSNESLDVLQFMKSNHQELNSSNYKVISNSGFSSVPSILTSSVIKSLNPNGLFKATVSASNLMTYADGTVSSIIKEGGKITSHAGFISAEASVFAPIAIMQVLSMLTGQYYMNGIAKQLEIVNQKLDHIKKLMVNKDLGEISGIYLRLKEIMDKECYSQIDLISVANLRTDLYKLQEQYRCNLNDSVAYVKQVRIDAMTEKAFLSDFTNKYASSDGYMYSTMLFVLNELIFMNKALEMQINARIGDYKQYRSCYEEIKNYEMNKTYLDSIQNFYLKFSELLNLRMKKFPERYERPELLNSVNSFASEKKQCYKSIEDSSLGDLKIPIVLEMEKPKETLLLVNNEGKSLLLQAC